MLKKLFLGLGIEFGPIVVFFLISEKVPFIKATAIFVFLTIVALIVGFIERKALAWFPIVVGATVVGFGSLTVIFDNPFFIIIKDTLYNGFFALVLFVGLIFNKGLLKPLFDNLFAMTDEGWRILSLRWAIMFTILSISNEIIRLHLDPKNWINYKLLATFITMIFSVYQFRLSKKERLPDSTEWGMRIAKARVKI